MNTIDDLRAEFAALAADAPGDDAVRAALKARLVQREKRRRTTALVAVAAAVVLVAGGIGITSAALRSAPDSTRPASIPPVVPVPEVPLPADTQLIRHQLQPVTSPVTAIAPAGLAGLTWIQSPGRLTVSFFDVTAAGGAAQASDAVRAAGYVITNGPDDPVWTFGQGGAKTAAVTRRGITIGGHEATLTTGPPQSTDASGFPAAERISWQLPDGRHIHVWATGLPTRDSSPDGALTHFAESITDSPQMLPRTVGVGLTLPGLTTDSTMNSMPVAGYIGGSVILCPPDIDPYRMSIAGESGATSSAAAASDPAASDTYQGSVAPAGSPTAPCLTVGVINATGADLGSGERTRIDVGGVQVSVSPDDQTAMVDLGNGLMAAVAAPDSVTLSNADLAAVAASVRLSPSVVVIPIDPSGSGNSGAASAWGSASAAVSSSATAIPGGAPAPNVDSNSGNPIDVDRADAVTAALGPDGTVLTVEFTLRNMSEKTANLQSLNLEIPGLARTSTRVRLDNTPADADSAFRDAVLPAMLAPGTRVRIQVAFNLHQAQCSAATEGVPTLKVEWQAESSGGGFSENVPITDPADGLKVLLSPFCP